MAVAQPSTNWAEAWFRPRVEKKAQPGSNLSTLRGH